jgi:hypothetical protein
MASKRAYRLAKSERAQETRAPWTDPSRVPTGWLAINQPEIGGGAGIEIFVRFNPSRYFHIWRCIELGRYP